MASSTDEQEIHNLATAVVDALNRADTRAYAAYFDEDADYTSAVGMQVRGRDAIQALHDVMFSEPQTPDWPSFRNAGPRSTAFGCGSSGRMSPWRTCAGRRRESWHPMAAPGTTGTV